MARRTLNPTIKKIDAALRFVSHKSVNPVIVLDGVMATPDNRALAPCPLLPDGVYLPAEIAELTADKYAEQLGISHTELPGGKWALMVNQHQIAWGPYKSDAPPALHDEENLWTKNDNAAAKLMVKMLPTLPKGSTNYFSIGGGVLSFIAPHVIIQHYVGDMSAAREIASEDMKRAVSYRGGNIGSIVPDGRMIFDDGAILQLNEDTSAEIDITGIFPPEERLQTILPDSFEEFIISQNDDLFMSGLEASFTPGAFAESRIIPANRMKYLRKWTHKILRGESYIVGHSKDMHTRYRLEMEKA